MECLEGCDIELTPRRRCCKGADAKFNSEAGATCNQAWGFLPCRALKDVEFFRMDPKASVSGSKLGIAADVQGRLPELLFHSPSHLTLPSNSRVSLLAFRIREGLSCVTRSCTARKSSCAYIHPRIYARTYTRTFELSLS